MPPGDAERLEVTAGSPLKRSDGLELRVDQIVYAHVVGGRNLSGCRVMGYRGGEQATVSLMRETGAPLEYQPLLGIRVAIDSADPYSRPGRAVLWLAPR